MSVDGTYMEKIIDFPVMILAVSFISLLLSALPAASSATMEAFARRRTGGLRHCSGRNAYAARPAYRFYLFDGHQSIRPAQNLRRRRSQRDRNGIRSRRCSASGGCDCECANYCEIYWTERVRFYNARDSQPSHRSTSDTAQLQNQLWYAVAVLVQSLSRQLDCACSLGHERCVEFAGVHPSRLVEPHSARGLGLVGSDCDWLQSVDRLWHTSEQHVAYRPATGCFLSFFLIADIDSPRGGVIRVQPQNLISLSQSLQAH